MSSGSIYDDRRDGDDRRKDDAEVKAEAETPKNIVPERRLSTDRRGWPFGLILRTSESYQVLEDWLEESCRGKWGLGLEDMDDALAMKSFKVMFEEETDKNAFMARFTRR